MIKWRSKKEFKDYVLSYAEKLKINVTSIYMRPMKNKWASCSTDGNLSFNKDLLKIEKELGEYVVIHELLHFRTPNHGILWKSYMNTYLPDWKDLDKKLKATLQIVNQTFNLQK